MEEFFWPPPAVSFASEPGLSAVAHFPSEPHLIADRRRFALYCTQHALDGMRD
jgi:hypothetical protein